MEFSGKLPNELKGRPWLCGVVATFCVREGGRLEVASSNHARGRAGSRGGIGVRVQRNRSLFGPPWIGMEVPGCPLFLFPFLFRVGRLWPFYSCLPCPGG